MRLRVAHVNHGPVRIHRVRPPLLTCYTIQYLVSRCGRTAHAVAVRPRTRRGPKPICSRTKTERGSIEDKHIRVRAAPLTCRQRKGRNVINLSR